MTSNKVRFGTIRISIGSEVSACPAKHTNEQGLFDFDFKTMLRGRPDDIAKITVSVSEGETYGAAAFFDAAVTNVSLSSLLHGQVEDRHFTLFHPTEDTKSVGDCRLRLQLMELGEKPIGSSNKNVAPANPPPVPAVSYQQAPAANYQQAPVANYQQAPAVNYQQPPQMVPQMAPQQQAYPQQQYPQQPYAQQPYAGYMTAQPVMQQGYMPAPAAYGYNQQVPGLPQPYYPQAAYPAGMPMQPAAAGMPMPYAQNPAATAQFYTNPGTPYVARPTGGYPAYPGY